MPVTYHIDKLRGRIHTKCSGEATLDEAFEHLNQLQKDPDCPAVLNVLLDLTDTVSVPESEGLRQVSEEMIRIQPRIRFNAFAILVPNDHLFGMSRMFIVFARNTFRAGHVFRTFENADLWLNSFPLPPPEGHVIL